MTMINPAVTNLSPVSVSSRDHEPLLLPKDENGTEISQTKPLSILDSIVSYFKYKSRKQFRHFSTVFYFSTFNLKYFEFKIWFKPNLVSCTVTQPNYRLLTMHLHSFYWWLAVFLLAIDCLFLFICGLLY